MEDTRESTIIINTKIHVLSSSILSSIDEILNALLISILTYCILRLFIQGVVRVMRMNV